MEIEIRITPPSNYREWMRVRRKLEHHGWREERPIPRHWVFSRIKGTVHQKLYVDFYLAALK
jgi:hypothetical protein